jgi:nitrous oxidase accessory protein NosD
LGFLAIVLLATGDADAATRVVDDDGADCSDATYTTITAAVAAAGKGDRIRVCPGTYAEQIVLDKPVTLVGKPGAGGRPVIRPTTLPVAPTSLIGPVGVRAAIVIDRTGASVRDLDVDLQNLALASCQPLAGVYFRASTGVLRGIGISGVRVTGDPACSSGIGVYVESGQVGVENGAPVYGEAKVTVSSLRVTNTQKGGIVGRGAQTILKVQ